MPRTRDSSTKKSNSPPFQKSREHEMRKPKLTLAERLKIADVAVAPSRTLDSAPELLI